MTFREQKILARKFGEHEQARRLAIFLASRGRADVAEEALARGLVGDSFASCVAEGDQPDQILAKVRAHPKLK